MTKNLNERICIVGAGPSGLSAAWYLQKKGYTDVTVLERLDRVGGKCDSPEYKGKNYEMGAIMGVPSYHDTREIMAEVGVEADGPKLDRKFYDARTGLEMMGIKEEEIPELKAQMAKMGELLATKYKGYNDPGHLNIHPDLMETFYDFCMMNEVPLCMKIWINPYTAYGYGYFNLVPAAYVLKYLDWETMNSFIKKDLITWKKGSQEVWKELSYRLNRKPRLCTKIQKVVRENDKVYVYTEFGKEEYDKIIFTSPLQDLHLYVDVTEEEAELFSKIKYEDYKVFACTVENYPTISGYIPGNMMQCRSGHAMVYYHRWENEPEQLITVYVLGDPQEKVGVKEARQLIEEDLKTLGINLVDIVMHKSWRYFPHVNCDELKHGWYDKVEGMQGELGTYYAGEVMNFGNIDECVAYSKLIVERFF